MDLQNFSLDKNPCDSVFSGTSSTSGLDAFQHEAADLGREGSGDQGQPACLAKASELVGFCLAASMSSGTGPDGQPTIADVLLRLGLWPIDRPKREEMAADLLLAGFKSEDVAIVGARVTTQAGAPRYAIGQMVKLFRDHARLRSAVQDCRDLHVAEDGAARRWHPGEIDRRRTAERMREERQTWAAADREHWIRCRVRDGVPQDAAEAEWEQRRRAGF